MKLQGRMTIAKVRRLGRCPKCGRKIEFGFGLCGGGYGSYVFCVGDETETLSMDDGCGFFLKEQDPDA